MYSIQPITCLQLSRLPPFPVLSLSNPSLRFPLPPPLPRCQRIMSELYRSLHPRLQHNIRPPRETTGSGGPHFLSFTAGSSSTSRPISYARPWERGPRNSPAQKRRPAPQSHINFRKNCTWITCCACRFTNRYDVPETMLDRWLLMCKSCCTHYLGACVETDGHLYGKACSVGRDGGVTTDRSLRDEEKGRGSECARKRKRDGGGDGNSNISDCGGGGGAEGRDLRT